MRTLLALMAGAAAAATVAAVAMAPAMADPINSKGKPVLPREKDITGVGSDTIQNLLDQFSLDYNATVKTAAPHLYSWDATNPATGAVGDLIKAKFGCAKAPRPNGSSAGIISATGGPLAQDGVTWATNPGSPAPNSLTLTQLIKIYSCKITNWKQVGGKSAKIDVQLPQAGSGTRAFWLAALGITQIGKCIDSAKGERARR